LIAYGCTIADERRYESCARAGIERVREPTAPIYEIRESDSIFSAYNEMLDRARGEPEVEALALPHEDFTIRDDRFVPKVREVLGDPDVAIIGVIGAIGIGGIDWWIHERTVGAATLRSPEPFPPWGPPLIGEGTRVGPGGTGPVDMVDGMILILSRWAIDELRFDESLGPGFDGYDADICFQARERGRKVWVADLDVEHHHRWADLGNEAYSAGWKRAHVAFRRKWEGRMSLRMPPRVTDPAAEPRWLRPDPA
jgi:glycosyl transferase family 2